MNYKYTAEELLSQQFAFEVMTKELGKDMNHLYGVIRDFHAKTRNYKENTFYHVITIEYSELGSGVGEGLYLGKDKDALINFYGLDYEPSEVPIQTFYGNPNFLDLTYHDIYKEFKEIAKQSFPYEENNNELRKLTLQIDYDGIRYYDPLATGEEFVLYNTNKVKLIETKNVELQ